MTAVTPAAVEAFRAAEQRTWTEAAPISQGAAAEVNRAAVRAGLEAALPLLTPAATARANEAARLSADARDEVADRDKEIARLHEQLGIVEESRQDLAAWAVKFAMKYHAGYREHDGGMDPFEAIEEALADVAELRRLNDDSANTRDRAMDRLESAQATTHRLVTAGVRNDEIHRRAARPLLEAVGFTADEARAIIAAAEEES